MTDQRKKEVKRKGLAAAKICRPTVGEQGKVR